MEPTAPLPASGPGSVPPGGSGKPWPAIILGILAAVLAVVLIVVLANDDDEDVATDDTTTTEQTTSTTTSTTEGSTTTSTTATTQPGGLPDAEAASVVWPDPTGDLRYDSPMAAVEGFAEDLLGFVDPTYSEFLQGDNRSGEAEVRQLPDGAATTVAVRQMSDGDWYVLFASTPELELTEPTAQTAIDNPLQVAGRSRSFEGQVRIAVYQRGGTEPLGEGFVTGGSGEALEPFTGEVEWENPGGGWGVVVASTEGGPDGSILVATAIPVGFIGGD